MELVPDAVFGRKQFINEIVRRRAEAKNDATTRALKNHDTILAYGKKQGWKWNPSYEPYNLKRLQKRYTKKQIKALSIEDQ